MWRKADKNVRAPLQMSSQEAKMRIAAKEKVSARERCMSTRDGSLRAESISSRTCNRQSVPCRSYISKGLVEWKTESPEDNQRKKIQGGLPHRYPAIKEPFCTKKEIYKKTESRRGLTG